MYKMDHFTEKDTTKIIAFIKDNAFATVTGFGEIYPVATQVPLEVECIGEKIFLLGHFMKKTTHHKAFENNNKVLVLFTGPHCYVSASWYHNPQTASTWNYMTVQASGELVYTDEASTFEAIKSVTNKYEGTDTSAAFNKIPIEYIDLMLKAIVGFRIEVKSLEATFKLSQNKKVDEQLNIIDKLRARGDEQSANIALEMEKLIPVKKEII